MHAPKSASHLAVLSTIAPADKVADDAHERRMTAAYSQMTVGIRCRPGGKRRWLFDKAITGAYRPHANPQEMQDAAITGGATVEQATAWMVPLHARAVAMVARRDGVAVPALRDCIRHETAAQYALDVPQLEAMANPTRADLERIITAGAAHIDAIRQCVERAAIELRALDEQRGAARGALGLDTGRAS
jgi:hypothetical protein